MASVPPKPPDASKAAGRTPKKSTPKKSKASSSIPIASSNVLPAEQPLLSRASVPVLTAATSAKPTAESSTTLPPSKKRSDVETPNTREKEEPAKKRVKFVEPITPVRQKGPSTPPHRRPPPPQHLGISPIKFDAGQSREVYWAPETVNGEVQMMVETRNGPTSSDSTADMTHFSSVWDILHQDSSENPTAETSVQNASAKPKISLSSLFSAPRPRRHDLQRANPTPRASANVPPDNSSAEAQFTTLPNNEVKALLQRLSSLGPSSSSQPQHDLDDSFSEQLSLPILEAAAVPSTTTLPTQDVQTPNGPSPTPTPVVVPSTSSIVPTPSLIKVSASTVPVQPLSKNPESTIHNPPKSVAATAPKKSIWGTRLSKGLLPTQTATPSASTIVPPTLTEPSVKRSLTADASILPSSQPPVPMTTNVSLSRYVSEPVLSQSSQNAAKEAAKDMLSWIEAAGFTFDELLESPTATTKPSTFFDRQGEKSTNGDGTAKADLNRNDATASRPVESTPICTPHASQGTMSDDDIVERYSEYFELPEELGAELEQIEQLRAMVPSQPAYEEEEEETVLTTSRFRRFLVLEVSAGAFDEIKLRTIDEANGMEHFLCLRDEWASLEIQSGDCVNVVGRVEPKGSSYTYIVDATRNLLILHPDVLVSGTMLAHTADCKRRAILNHSVKFHPRVDITPPSQSTITDTNSAAGGPVSPTSAPVAQIPTITRTVNPAMIDPRHALYGTFVHELFQLAVDSMDFTIATLKQNVEKLIVDHIVNIFSIGDSEANVRLTLTGWIPAITDWANRFFPPARTDLRLMQQRDPRSKFKATMNTNGDVIELLDQKYLLEVVKTVEIEEHVVSIMYGLKGDIDVSLLVKLTPLPPSTTSLRYLPPSTAMKSYLLPLEIKSGNLNSAYASQVILYSLLMADRYNRDIPIAILFSLKESNTVALEITRRQVLFGIQNRNRIAAFVHRPHPMPPLLGVSDPCSRCYQIDSCMILHKAFEPAKMKFGIAPALYDSITANLTSTRHVAFLSHWFTLIDMESSEILRYRNQVWSMPQRQREKEGRCLGGMRLVSISSHGPQRVSIGAGTAAPTSPIDALSSSLGVQTQESQPSQGSSQKKISTGKRQLFLTFERWPLSIGSTTNNDSIFSPVSSLRAPTSSSLAGTAPSSSHGKLLSILGPVGNRIDTAIVEDSIDATQTDSTPTSRHVSFTDLQFGLGDHIVLSEGRHLAIATCSVVELTSHSITLVCNRPFLRAPPKEYATVLPTSQRFTPLSIKSMAFKDSPTKAAPIIHDIESLPGVTGMLPSQSLEASIHPEFHTRNLKNMRWRLDRDEVQSGFNMLKGNVIQLFQSTFWARKFRRLIVDLEPPTFIDTPLTREEEEFISVPSSENDRPMNEDQIRAVNKVLDARDYALILGMPGTGKTTTIAKIVSILIKRGKTVLISAGTHSAVDALLLQISKLGIEFLRLGQPDLVHPDIRHHTLNYESSTKSVEELEKLVGPGSNRFQLVGATCPGTNHQLLSRRTFDYCIVDESSQITLPVILGPLRLASTLIMVGDLYQLPPVVKNAQALQGGLSTSLFKRLSEAHPSAVHKLRLQYRMNSEIMSLSNELIYQNQLVCGNQNVALQSLEIPFLDQLPTALKELRSLKQSFLPSVSFQDHWMRSLLNPDRKVVFLNTDQIPEAVEERLELKDITRNPSEANIVTQIAYCLIKVGLSNKQIGVISPLKAQLKLIQSHLHSMGLNSPRNSIDVFTVDKYQGSDVDCLMISFVRSNPVKSVGTLLKDWRRINVAFTRAKRKIILIGSRSTLSSNHLLAAFFQMVDEKGWELKLPPDALKS